MINQREYSFRQNAGRPRLLALLVAAAAAQLAAAQEELAVPEKPPVPLLTEIRVEGRAVREEVSDLALDVARFGTQVQVIDAEEIKTGGFTNFGELSAGLIRGANIGYSPDEGEFTIRIDGGTDRDTLLLLNGVPTFDRGTPLETIWGATSVDPRMIERVEIFRGGQSLYFGSNGGLGVVNAIYKQPEAGDEVKGETGFYAGSFKTREMYGNVTVPVDAMRQHYLMFFGRSYETDAHELFSEPAYVDNILALGGKHDFPYSYNLGGVKYLWAINDETELRLGYQMATVDFEDSFPNSTVYTPNFTEFPIYDLKFSTRFSDALSYEAEAYYIAPKLWNTELDPRLCHIPRVQDLPAEAQAQAAAQGITSFGSAGQFEAFAAGQGLPAGCVTNPYGDASRAATASRDSYYADENGRPYGTFDNPFPIGAPMGYVIQSASGFGDGVPTKGFGGPDQHVAGYKDYGFNNRLKLSWRDSLEGVVGLQRVAYKDDSSDVYGMDKDAVSSTGLYAEMRANSDYLIATNFSFAARHDFNDKFEDEMIWKYGFRQQLPFGLYLRSNGGTSYSQPTTSELGMRRDRVLNPNLETQSVESYSLGLGINGDLPGGTYNVEVGYFDTVIDNMFGSARIENACINYPDVTPADINPAIVPPTAFCEYALAQGIARTETVSFNRRQEQQIEGLTLDIAVDWEQWGLDFTYTMMDSVEPNPIYNQRAILAGSGQVLDFVVPGSAGADRYRQSSERPEWSASALVTWQPSQRWILSLNPKWQGPEWAWGGGRSSRLVDANGNRTNPDLNFGDYFVLNGSLQLFLGDMDQHRFLIRGVNLLDKDYYERASASADQRLSRAAVRGEIGIDDPQYYYQYGWNGKPRSFWLQYEYQF